MAHNKGLHGSSGGSYNRGRSYVLIILITFGAALLGVMVLHKLRERRIYNLLVKEKDHQLLALQLLLQKERDRTKELRGKNEEMKAKIYALRSQKLELARTVVEMQSTMDSLKDEQKVMESALEENQKELRIMEEKESNLGQGESEIITLRENLMQKEAEINDLKHRLGIPVKTYPVNIDDHPTMFPETVTVNGTMEAQDKAENNDKEKDENSRESAKYGGDDRHVTNGDARKSTLTKFKDGEVTAETKDEIGSNDELGKKNEDLQEGSSVTAKDRDTDVVDGREKKAIREEKPGQLKNNTDRRGQDLNRKQLAGAKRRHGHVSRTKGKRWRTIVKNRIMENNGISESHGEVNVGNRKVNKDDLKDRIVGRVSDEKTFAREDVGRDNNNPRKDMSQAKLLKPENHENREAGKGTTVDNTNHQVTNNGINSHPENQRLDGVRQSEEHEESLVQQKWSRRHINKASKNAGQTKSNKSHEESEVSDVQKQVKDVIEGDGDGDGDDDEDEDNNNDYFKESHSEFQDEKQEYKEEIDESEFQPDL